MREPENAQPNAENNGPPTGTTYRSPGDPFNILRVTMRSYLSLDEDTKGSLENGKLADLAVLDRDDLACLEGEITAIEVAKTMVDGRFVFDRERNP